MDIWTTLILTLRIKGYFVSMVICIFIYIERFLMIWNGQSCVEEYNASRKRQSSVQHEK
jgi:hypothetical protein